MAGGIMSAELPGCAVLGAGTMGAGIALSLALGGAEVKLWGRQTRTLSNAVQRIGSGFDFLAGHGLVSESARGRVIDRITTVTDLSKAVDGTGFIIEAVAENLEIKQTLLRRAEEQAPDDAVTSSTTSAISATKIQKALMRPENFCIAHYAQPAHLVELVEVVAGAQTSQNALQRTNHLLKVTGKTPVVCPDVPGFLWARIQHAVLREFVSLVDKGLVKPEACDTILKVGYASRLPAMGAFEHADLAGIDLLSGDAAKTVWADLSNVRDPDDTVMGAMKGKGWTGMTSGRGFYDWKTRDPDAFKANRDKEIIRRIKINRGADIT